MNEPYMYEYTIIFCWQNTYSQYYIPLIIVVL